MTICINCSSYPSCCCRCSKRHQKSLARQGQGHNSMSRRRAPTPPQLRLQRPQVRAGLLQLPHRHCHCRAPLLVVRRDRGRRGRWLCPRDSPALRAAVALPPPRARRARAFLARDRGLDLQKLKLQKLPRLPCGPRRPSPLPLPEQHVSPQHPVLRLSSQCLLRELHELPWHQEVHLPHHVAGAALAEQAYIGTHDHTADHDRTPHCTIA